MFKVKNPGIYPTILHCVDEDGDSIEVIDEGDRVGLTAGSSQEGYNDRTTVLLDQKEATDLARILLDWATGQNLR